MSDLSYQVETLSGINYYSSGNTTVFVMHGIEFAMIGKSPAKAVKDIEKKSKVLIAILDVMKGNNV